MSLLDVVLVRGRAGLPVEGVVGVGGDAVGVVVAHRLRRLDGAGLAGGEHVEADRFVVAQRLGLLGEGDEVAAPQAGEDGLGLLRHLRVDEGRVVGLAELGPLLVDDLDVRPELLEVIDEGPGHVLAEGVVGAHGRHPLDVPLGQDLGRGAALDRRVRGGAEDVGMQVLGLGQHIGLDHGHDEDDLVLLGHRRDGRPFGRRQRADQELDVLAQDQVAGDAYGLVGVALGVAHDELELAAENAALGVDLLDEHLRALERRLADQRAGTGEDDRIADPDGLLRRGDAGDEGAEREETEDEMLQPAHGVSPVQQAVRMPA